MACTSVACIDDKKEVDASRTAIYLSTVRPDEGALFNGGVYDRVYEGAYSRNFASVFTFRTVLEDAWPEVFGGDEVIEEFKRFEDSNPAIAKWTRTSNVSLKDNTRLHVIQTLSFRCRVLLAVYAAMKSLAAKSDTGFSALRCATIRYDSMLDAPNISAHVQMGDDIKNMFANSPHSTASVVQFLSTADLTVARDVSQAATFAVSRFCEQIRQPLPPPPPPPPPPPSPPRQPSPVKRKVPVPTAEKSDEEASADGARKRARLSQEAKEAKTTRRALTVSEAFREEDTQPPDGWEPTRWVLATAASGDLLGAPVAVAASASAGTADQTVSALIDTLRGDAKRVDAVESSLRRALDEIEGLKRDLTLRLEAASAFAVSSICSSSIQPHS